MSESYCVCHKQNRLWCIIIYYGYRVRPELSRNSYVLKTTFPNKELVDETVTIATANLINAVVVQHPK